ncbi:hypothetical protein FGG08_000530 [Glutinoglossum americanum]|uniref:Uncharacterized protein n=1 Tax=Glutinoglossum americanum TaxID=1670608 RepID=A0A9P8I8T0_9PEZI|nr:hypothetical protein FGG08_000530 [Glutinoglossum americanum]
MRARDATDTSPYDFVGLHIIAKHCIYLIESFNALIRTLGRMRADHKRLFRKAVATQTMLEYRTGLFHSAKLRLVSMDSRTKNIIALAFNLVTQQDSRVMQKDSDSMNTIAVLTMVFLPASTIATIFGSQFFNLDSSHDPPTFIVSTQFWIFWVVTLPVTVTALSTWWMLHQRRVGRNSPWKVGKAQLVWGLGRLMGR